MLALPRATKLPGQIASKVKKAIVKWKIHIVKIKFYFESKILKRVLLCNFHSIPSSR